jgi:hypothetical protein
MTARELDAEALNSATWKFLDAWKNYADIEIPAVVWNNSKPMIRASIEEYLEQSMKASVEERMNKRIIELEIEAEDKWCDSSCQFFELFYTGIAGEWHPKCVLFSVTGEWQAFKMLRGTKCLEAEKNP